MPQECLSGSRYIEDPGIAQVAMDFDAYGYLSKPVRRSAVLIGVMTALRRRDVEARERAARLSLEDTLRLRTSALTDALERLEADERLAVEQHPTVGHEMLSGSSSGLLDLTAIIAETHHEKFDGQSLRTVGHRIPSPSSELPVRVH